MLHSLQSRTYALKNFLEGYCSEYASAEVNRRKAFFDEARLDEEQKTAVVKDESHHLVIAAAGSGKTRTLTARIALLIERGVPQERILALTYTNAAVAEMTSRLNSQYGIKANVNTFHSFCHDLAKESQDFRSGVAGAKEHQFIRQAAERLASNNKDFALKMLNFAEEFKRAEEKKQQEFPTAEEYYKYLRHQEYQTLNLVPVKSIAECEIGNFLFLHGVRFEYEASAKWADRSPAFRDYQPDFFLPDYGLYLEHWASDRKGRVPDWFSDGGSGDPSERYREGMEWKRDQFKKQNRRLVETFHYQVAEGDLLRNLRMQLEANGVMLADLPMDEVIRRIDGEIRRDPLHEIVLSFIKRGKTNGLVPSDIQARLESGNWTKKQRDFASLMVLIWIEYENLLRESNMLDFNDMVTLALQVARKKGSDLAKQYPHILVDEFQDITDPQLELIRCISSGSGNGGTLFCVGDHRQNIFSFAGSNVKNILEFDESFPDSERTLLSTNYRCPSNVVRASNQLMVSHPGETPAVPMSTEVRPIRLIQKSDNLQYDKWEAQSARTLLNELLETKKDDEDILVLARYNFRYQDLDVFWRRR